MDVVPTDDGIGTAYFHLACSNHGLINLTVHAVSGNLCGGGLVGRRFAFAFALCFFLQPRAITQSKGIARGLCLHHGAHAKHENACRYRMDTVLGISGRRMVSSATR